MIKTVLLVAALATPISGGSLKDTPSHAENGRDGVRDFWEAVQDEPKPKPRIGVALPAKAPYLRVHGMEQPFRVPNAVLHKYRLRPGQIISRDLARFILKDLGIDYPEGTLEQLQRLDRKEFFDEQLKDVDRKSPSQ